LNRKGVTFEHYDNMTDGRSIFRGLSKDQGPDRGMLESRLEFYWTEIASSSRIPSEYRP
jgi:hypothetical protein